MKDIDASKLGDYYVDIRIANTTQDLLFIKHYLAGYERESRFNLEDEFDKALHDQRGFFPLETYGRISDPEQKAPMAVTFIAYLTEIEEANKAALEKREMREDASKPVGYASFVNITNTKEADDFNPVLLEGGNVPPRLLTQVFNSSFILVSLCVEPTCRNNKIGRAIVRHAFRHIDLVVNETFDMSLLPDGVQPVILAYPERSNTEACKCLSHCGFNYQQEKEGRNKEALTLFVVELGEALENSLSVDD